MLKHEFYKDLESRSRNYKNIFDKYKNIAINMFKWEGLPIGLESRLVEKALFDYGNAILFKPNGEEIGLENFNEGYLLLGANCGSNYNVYGEPTEYVANGYNQSFNRNIKDCVLCRNNPLSTPTINYVIEFSEKMDEVSRSIRTNIIQQKFPFIIPCKAENELTMKNLYKKIIDGEMVIFKDESLDLDGLKVLDTRVPYVADSLNEYRFELEREILTHFGINNNFEKKERLLVDEVNSNNDYVDCNIDLMFEMRKDFCNRANKKYGLNISVKKNYDVSRETIKEGVENE